MGEILVITSAVVGNGSKYIAMNLAYEFKKMKKNKRKKVLLIDLDIENPSLAYHFVSDERVHGLDNLANYIAKQGIDESIFMQNVLPTKWGFDILKGTEFAGKTKLFSKEQITAILNQAREMYNQIYVAVTCKTNNAGSVVAFSEADKILLVLRNNATNYIKVDKALRIIKEYSQVEKLYCVYNFNNSSVNLDINSRLADSGLSVDIVGVLNYEEHTLDNVNLKKKSVFKTANMNEFRKINKAIWS